MHENTFVEVASENARQTEDGAAEKMTISERMVAGGNLSLKEFAVWAGVSLRTVYLEIDARRLDTRSIGRRRIVPAAAARDWQARL